MPFGAEVKVDGSVRFRLYAPAIEQVQLQLDTQPDPLRLRRDRDGWHELITGAARIGTCYRFLLPDGLAVPDPASRFQPRDVSGPSQVVAPGSFLWHDSAWTGRRWEDTVLYELHIGTFTEEGTFQAAIARLDHLADLGVTAIEIMPVADFPGRRGWGYDGVLLFAPDSAYGHPDDFRALVDAAHQRGLSVILDVVYNHFGPDGNYIATYNPDILTSRHKTNWGDAVNYDGDGSHVNREFVIHNALYWIEEFHVDGLRLDAVHAIIDDSSYHLLDELADRVRTTIPDRPIHLILENEKNQACRLDRSKNGEPRHYTAQWNDDIHHVLHTAGTHEDAGYYKDYKGDTNLLGRALAEGFALQGQCTSTAEPVKGEPSAYLPPTAFVAFIQNHDQIGNRALGERINALVNPEVVRALAAIYLLLPQVPMLFMGEEWCATQPFPYFCDFPEDLGSKIRDGRRAEFSKFPEFHDPAQQNRIPDPLAEETFRSAKLVWSELGNPAQAEWLGFYRHLLEVRRHRIQPLLPHIQANAGHFTVIGPAAVHVCWKVTHGRKLHLRLNLCDHPQTGFGPTETDVLWQEGNSPANGHLQPWSVLWTLSSEDEGPQPR